MNSRRSLHLMMVRCRCHIALLSGKYADDGFKRAETRAHVHAIATAFIIPVRSRLLKVSHPSVLTIRRSMKGGDVQSSRRSKKITQRRCRLAPPHLKLLNELNSGPHGQNTRCHDAWHSQCFGVDLCHARHDGQQR